MRAWMNNQEYDKSEGQMVRVDFKPRTSYSIIDIYLPNDSVVAPVEYVQKSGSCRLAVSVDSRVC